MSHSRRSSSPPTSLHPTTDCSGLSDGDELDPAYGGEDADGYGGGGGSASELDVASIFDFDLLDEEYDELDMDNDLGLGLGMGMGKGMGTGMGKGMGMGGVVVKEEDPTSEDDMRRIMDVLGGRSGSDDDEDMMMMGGGRDKGKGRAGVDVPKKHPSPMRSVSHLNFTYGFETKPNQRSSPYAGGKSSSPGKKHLKVSAFSSSVISEGGF